MLGGGRRRGQKKDGPLGTWQEAVPFRGWERTELNWEQGGPGLGTEQQPLPTVR